MPFLLLLTILLIGGCATIDVAHIDVHARSAVFNEEQLPPIEFMRQPGDEGRRQAGTNFEQAVRYFDADYNEVTRAAEPGRYGAIVALRNRGGGREVHRYLTLFRMPGHLDWDGARLDLRMRVSPQFGFAPDVLDAQRDQVGEFFKFALLKSAQTSTNESNWQGAAVVAGLYEASHSKQPHKKPFVQREGFAATDQRWWFGLKRKLHEPGLPYVLVFHPHFQPTQPTTKRPLIVFLHGSGEAGDGGPDLAKLNHSGLPELITGPDPALPKDFPFLVLAPQVPPETNWSPYEVMSLVDEICGKYPVDTDRIYLTGLSLGGYGVWDTAMAYPDRFAAIAPVAGAGDAADVERIRGVPVWIFHGAQDPTVPVGEAQRMAEALKAIGSPPKLTIYPDVKHGSWAKAYREPELYQWFLAHRRGGEVARGMLGPG